MQLPELRFEGALLADTPEAVDAVVQRIDWV